MSSPSPGPGWWLASDGTWYPQRWEYTWIDHTNENLHALTESVGRVADRLGQQGWEMVSSSMERTEIAATAGNYKKVSKLTFEYSIVCFLKRPIRQ
jgi:hypothetical protein